MVKQFSVVLRLTHCSHNRFTAYMKQLAQQPHSFVPTSYGVPLFTLLIAVASYRLSKVRLIHRKSKCWFQKQTAQPECQWRDYWIVCTLCAKLANRWVLDLFKRTFLSPPAPMRNSWKMCCLLVRGELNDQVIFTLLQ